MPLELLFSFYNFRFSERSSLNSSDVQIFSNIIVRKICYKNCKNTIGNPFDFLLFCKFRFSRKIVFNSKFTTKMVCMPLELLFSFLNFRFSERSSLSSKCTTKMVWMPLDFLFYFQILDYLRGVL